MKTILWEVEDNELWGGETPNEENQLIDYNIDPFDGYNLKHPRGIWFDSNVTNDFDMGKDYILSNRAAKKR
jgi:hypothetical protein